MGIRFERTEMGAALSVFDPDLIVRAMRRQVLGFKVQV